MTLDCTAKGDVRFHPDVAKVSMYGVNDTIGNHFRNSKRDKEGNVTDDSQMVAYLDVNGVRVPNELAEQYYVCLWYQCIMSTPFIQTQLAKYDDYYDGKRDGAINSQAKVFRMYKQGGFNALKSFCSDFLACIKNPSTKDAEREKAQLEQTAAKENVVNNLVFPSFDDINLYANSVGKKVVADGGTKDDCCNYENILKYKFHVRDVAVDEKIKGFIERLIDVYYDYYNKNLTETYAQRKMHEVRNQYQSFVECLGKK